MPPIERSTADTSPLRRHRQARGWRLIDLARKTGCSRSSLSTIERGYVPNADVRRRIAQAFDVPEEALWAPEGATDTAAREAARALANLWKRLRERLGDDFYRGRGDVAFEITARGQPAIHVAGTTFFEGAQGEIVASKLEGGRGVFATVSADGVLEWDAVPAGDPALN